MSRVGKQPIPCPSEVDVKLQGTHIEMKGPKGTLSRELHPRMKILQEEGVLRVERPGEDRQDRALHGLTRSLLANMVQGVTDGFEKRLELVGLGYRVAVQGEKLILHLGYSHPIKYQPAEGVEIALDENNKNIIIVRGIDKEKVGQAAADIRHFRKPEPYKGKGVRYVGEYIRRKAGKAAVK